MRILAIVYRDNSTPEYPIEVRVYTDNWVELWCCAGVPYGIEPWCWKEYQHRTVPVEQIGTL